MKVTVNKETCIGCGNCEAVCPKIFVLKEGKSTVKISETDDPCAKQAAESCPVNAITVK